MQRLPEGRARWDLEIRNVDPPPTLLFREPPLEKKTASGGFLRFCHMLYKGNHFLGLPTKFLVNLPPPRSSRAKPEACCNLVTIIEFEL